MNPILNFAQSGMAAALSLVAVIFGCGIYGDEGASVSFDAAVDGKQIVFSSDSGDLFLFELDSKRVTRITESSEIEKSPSLSPDGKTVVYSATAPDDSSAFRIFKVDVGTKKVIQLTSDSGVSDSEPRFSGDGRKIYFSRAFFPVARPLGVRWSDADLFVMDADGNSQKRLTNEKYSYLGDMVMHPDGRSILFGAQKYIRAKTEDESDDLFESVYSVDLDGSRPLRNFGRVDWDDVVELSESTSAAKSDGSERISEDEPEKVDADPESAGTDQSSRFVVVGSMIVDLDEKKAGRISLKDHSVEFPRSIPKKQLLFLENVGTEDRLYELWTVGLDGKNPRKIAGWRLFNDPINWQPDN